VVVVAPLTLSLAVSSNNVARAAAQFTVSTTTAPGVTIQNVSLNYGDGSTDQLGVVGATPVVKPHTYAAGGTFTATASATYAGGLQPVTRSIAVVVSPCYAVSNTFSITSVVDATLNNWPGGQQTFNPVSGCSVTITAPTGNISNLSGDTWAIAGRAGYGSCTLTPQTPSCGSLGANSGLLGNGRPYCSNSSIVFGGTSTATAIVQCQ
jgi:hypothetical protein